MFRSVNTKIVAAFVAVLIATFAIVLVANYAITRNYEHALIDSMGSAAAEECATMIEIAYDEGSGGEFAPGTRDYEYCRELLRQVCQSSGMSYMYAYKVDVENETVTYILAVGASDEENELVSRERPYGTVVHGGITEAEEQALAGETSSLSAEINNQFGQMLDWFSPVSEMGDNVLAGASYSVDVQRRRVLTTTLSAIMPFVVALFALFIIEVIILRKGVFKPLRIIAQRMRSFSAESANQSEPLGITSNDEIGDIAEAFEGMSRDIVDYVSSIERLASERAQANVELDVARRIQQGMVPERTEMSGALFTACGFSRPARSVGGDFYDVFELEDGCLAMIVGDAAGKGVAAALFMAVVKTTIRDCLLGGSGPAKALSDANARIVQANPESMFVTSFICVFDSSNGEMRYANAGHMLPLLIGDGVRVLEVDPGEILGVFDDAVFEEGSMILKQGQGLLLYTDGAVEARDAGGSFLGEQRFVDSMSAGPHCADASSLVDAAVRVVDGFVGDSEQFDDLTVVALLYDGADETPPPDASGSPKAIALPCDMAAFSSVREALFATNADDALKRKACLACEEAFANVVFYSGAAQIWVQVRESDDQLRIELADDGAPFDPLTTETVEKDFDDLDSGGMGIDLVRQLSSQLEYQREGERNILIIVVS